MAKRVSVKGKGADLFFGDYPAPRPPAPADGAVGLVPEDPGSETGVAPTSEAPAGAAPSAPPEPVSPSRARSPRRPAKQSPATSELASNDDSVIASLLSITTDSKRPEDVEAIRRVVKTPGKEVSFVRLTPKEKEQLADVVYTYKRQGLKTTENEINRIAINALLADYRANGERSVLARVLAALLA